MVTVRTLKRRAFDLYAGLDTAASHARQDDLEADADLLRECLILTEKVERKLATVEAQRRAR